MLIIIFIRNSWNDVMSINSVSVDILPMNAPIKSLYIVVFLLSINETDNSNKKSNPKFKNNIKSIYIFNGITKIIIKKQHNKLCRFLWIW